MANKSWANREVADLLFIDYKTGVPFMQFDLANTTGYGLEGDAVFAFGGAGHPRRVQFSGNRSGTFTVETQMQTAKLYQLITGADLETTADFMHREVLTADATGKVTLTKSPVGTTVYAYEDGDDCGTALDATVSGKDVTIDGASEGDKIIVYYATKLTNVTNLRITSKNFPRAVRIEASTFQKTEDDEIIPYHMIAYKATAQSNFDVSFSNDGDPVSLTITFDLMVDDDGNLLDLIMEEDG